MATRNKIEMLPESLRIQAEAHAFRSLINHLQERPHVQNMETMTASGFCRNCLSKWLLAGYRNMAPLPLDEPLTYEDVSFSVYGMSPKDWKKEYQAPATEDQLRRYEESKKYHAVHPKNVLEDISATTQLNVDEQQEQLNHQITASSPSFTQVLDPCCPESTESIAVTGPTLSPSLAPEPPATRVKLGILTVSDRAFNGVYNDESGPRIRKSFADYASEHTQVQVNVSCEKVVPDDKIAISETLTAWSNQDDNLNCCNIIVTTGGTGLSSRDVTPEATLSILDKQLSSIPLTICNQTSKIEPLACLSRGIAGCRGSTIILNVPGSPSAVDQHLSVAIPLLLFSLNALTVRSL